jgi:hypothetical protein
MKVFRRVAVRRVVATSDMSARAADPEMNPNVGRLQTFFAAERARSDVVNGSQMRALRHCGSPNGLEMRTWRMPEEIVNRSHDLSAFADSPADTLDRPGPYVADREHAGH